MTTLRLEIVREQLRLDVGYYSSADAGILSETIHRLMVAGKQVIQRPGLLLDAALKLDIKALWVSDRNHVIDKGTGPYTPYMDLSLYQFPRPIWQTATGDFFYSPRAFITDRRTTHSRRTQITAADCVIMIYFRGSTIPAAASPVEFLVAE